MLRPELDSGFFTVGAAEIVADAEIDPPADGGLE